MPHPETFQVTSGGSALSPSLSSVTTPPAQPRPSTAVDRSSHKRRNRFQKGSKSASRQRSLGPATNTAHSSSPRSRRRPSTAVTNSPHRGDRQWPKKQHFRSWRQNSNQLSALQPRPLPPSSFQDTQLARATWRDIDVSQLDVAPLHSISSQTIFMQEKIQTCIAQLGSAPYGKSKHIFTELANHTKTCFKRMEKNLAVVAEESSSVNVAQQAMHALSHSTLLQRVWKDVDYYVSSMNQRAAAAQERHEVEVTQVRETLEERIAALERQVQELTPTPRPIDVSDSDSDNEDDTNQGEGHQGDGGIVGRFTLDARDRNKRRVYSRTDKKLQQLSSDLMKWHEDQGAQNETMYTRLEIRKNESKLDIQKIRHSNGGHDNEETTVHMTPAARHGALEKFMYLISKVDEHGRALMMEELFMSFKGLHRIQAVAGMLVQVSSRNRLLLMTDMHNEMKPDLKRRFLEFSLKECDEELAHMLFESLCAKIPINRRRDLLHEQVDTLGTAQMMQIIQELIAESIGESSRLQLVDGLTQFLSPAEKRECIVNIIFGVAIHNSGHGYLVGDSLNLVQNENDDRGNNEDGVVAPERQTTDDLIVHVTGVGDGGKITAISLISVGKGYQAGLATCVQEGGAAFMLEPSSRSTRESLLSRLAVVMPKIKTMLNTSSGGSSPFSSPPGSPKAGKRR